MNEVNEVNVEASDSICISKGDKERNELVIATMTWWDKFNNKFNKKYEYPSILFDLKGSMAGWAKYYSQTINYNMDLYSRNKEAFINRTVPHEIAHLFTYKIHIENGRRDRLMPHGREWKNIMRFMGLEATRCHNYDITLSRKVKREYIYKCNCREHKVTSIIHNRMMKKDRHYKCRFCGNRIIFVNKGISSDEVENQRKKIEEEKKRLEEQLAMLG